MRQIHGLSSSPDHRMHHRWDSTLDMLLLLRINHLMLR